MNNERIISLDALRGLTVAMMIMVNNPGSWTHVYAPLLHAKWDGCTPTDLVFPFFLFIMGTAMWYSFKKRKSSKFSLSVKIIKRTALIFLLGLFLNAFPFTNFDLEKMRIFGVLQRIAVCYGLAAFIVILSSRTWNYIIAGVLLFGYWAILLLFGDLTLENNACLKLDLLILGENHLPRPFGIPFDQLGILSTLSSTVCVLLGYYAGRLIDESTSKGNTVKLLVLWGIGGVLTGLLWSLIFPLNKPLWSSSYILYSSGLASIMLAFLMYIIDIQGHKKWAHPLLVFGMNPLFLYVLSGIVAKLLGIIKVTSFSGKSVSLKSFLYQDLIVPWAGELNGSLVFAILFVLFFGAIGFVLYWKKIFIKI